MDQHTHLVCESIQEITLFAWPKIYGTDNPYDLDSAEVKAVCRGWGEEFENWWLSHDQDWIDDHDYLEEIWTFADRKVKEFLRPLAGKTFTVELKFTACKSFQVCAVDEADAYNQAKALAQKEQVADWPGGFMSLVSTRR